MQTKTNIAGKVCNYLLSKRASSFYACYKGYSRSSLQKSLASTVARGLRGCVYDDEDYIKKLLLCSLAICSKEPAGMRLGFATTLFSELVAGRVLIEPRYIAAVTQVAPLIGGHQTLLGFSDINEHRTRRSWAECSSPDRVSTLAFLSSRMDTESIAGMFNAVAGMNKGSVQLCAPACELSMHEKTGDLGYLLSDQTMESLSATGGFLAFDSEGVRKITGWDLSEAYGRPEFAAYYARANELARQGRIDSKIIKGSWLKNCPMVAFARSYSFTENSFSSDYELDGVSIDVAKSLDSKGGVITATKVAVRAANHILCLLENQLSLSARHYSARHRILRVKPINFPFVTESVAGEIGEEIAYGALFASINYAVRHRSFQAVLSENSPYRRLNVAGKNLSDVMHSKLDGVEWSELAYKISIQHKWRCNIECIDFSQAIQENAQNAYSLPQWSKHGYSLNNAASIDLNTALLAWGLGASSIKCLQHSMHT